MKPLYILFTSIFLWACNTDTQKEKQDTNIPSSSSYQQIGSIEILDSTLLDIIAKDTKIEILADGFTWSEGPVWVEELNSLLFSDVPENRIWRWSEKDSLQVFLEPSGYLGKGKLPEGGSNGLVLDPNGKLTLCQHGERQLAQLASPLSRPEAKFTTLADQYHDRRFNSPNDLVFDSRGNLYFTDPAYGLPQQMDDPNKEIPFQGVYRRNVNASIDLLIDSLSRPNGIALSPDEKTLYVAVSDPEVAHIMAYDLDTNGTITNGRTLVDATSFVDKQGMAGLPDGMAVNAKGIIFATAPGGVWIITPGGKILGQILTTQATANCTLSPDEKTLYMTADRYLLRLSLL